LSGRPFISICIPAYEMYGRGGEFLGELLQTVAAQSFTDVEVVVSDDSHDGVVADMCEEWADRLTMIHLPAHGRSPNPSANLNRSLAAARGEIVKPMHQDDFFTHPLALELIVAAIEGRPEAWGAVGFNHRRAFHGEPYAYRVPYYQDDIIGSNTIGGPSTVFLRAPVRDYVDPELIWVGDVELYYRLQHRHGPPLIVPDTLVCIRHWDHQVTNTLASDEEHRRKELEYALRKHRLAPPRAQAPAASSSGSRVRAHVPVAMLTAMRACRQRTREFGARLRDRRSERLELGPLGRLARHPRTILQIGEEPPPRAWLRAGQGIRVFVVEKGARRTPPDPGISPLEADLSNPWDLERVLHKVGGDIDLVVDADRQYPSLIDVLPTGAAYLAKPAGDHTVGRELAAVDAVEVGSTVLQIVWKR
jgi:hypothetical protein